MRTITLIILATLAITFRANAQIKFPVEFRVDKQSMSTPMTDLDEVIFLRSYYTRPVNIIFEGTHLNMFYDNGETFAKKNLTVVDHEMEYEDNKLALERYIYTDDKNSTDKILFVVDYNVGYVQVILPTKNSKGENIGYTSYRQFISINELALN
jgi:hypothetical protein